jgi:hypothetical protein
VPNTNPIVNIKLIVMEWIKVESGKMPMPYELCLIVYKGTVQEQVWQFCRKQDNEIWFEDGETPDYWFTYNQENQIELSDISHYMPLSALPKP